MPAAINLTERLYVDDDGSLYPITNLFDADGDECEPEDAVSAVAGDGGCWFAINLSEFENAGALQ